MLHAFILWRGVKKSDQAKRLFELGVEKISLQTSALHDLKLVEEIANRCGNQSLLISIVIKKNWLGKYEFYFSATRKTVKNEWKQSLRYAVSAGAGELVLNSVDKVGTML